MEAGFFHCIASRDFAAAKEPESCRRCADYRKHELTDLIENAIVGHGKRDKCEHDKLSHQHGDRRRNPNTDRKEQTRRHKERKRETGLDSP